RTLVDSVPCLALAEATDMRPLRPDNEVVEVHCRDLTMQLVGDLFAQGHQPVVAALAFTKAARGCRLASGGGIHRQHGEKLQAALEQALLQGLAQAAGSAGWMLVEV